MEIQSYFAPHNIWDKHSEVVRLGSTYALFPGDAPPRFPRLSQGSACRHQRRQKQFRSLRRRSFHVRVWACSVVHSVTARDPRVGMVVFLASFPRQGGAGRSDPRNGAFPCMLLPLTNPPHVWDYQIHTSLCQC